MDRDTIVLLVALLLMLIGYPLISAGTDGDVTGVWVAGLIAVGLGALIPPVARYVLVGDDDDNSNSNDNDET
jgi:hypothetical protein